MPRIKLDPYKTKVAGKILMGIEAGAEFSIKEWADELNIDIPSVRMAVSYLRKNGHLIYPVGRAYKQPGKLKNILEKVAYIEETTQRHDATYLAPHLESAFRIIEQSLPKFPQLRNEVTRRLKHFVNLLEAEDKQLKTIIKYANEHNNVALIPAKKG